MSTDIDSDIIDLSIQVNDTAPQKPSFDTPIIVGYHNAWLDDYVRQYSKASDLLDDGFTVSDPVNSHIYNMALALKSQPNAPSNFMVGRLATAFTQIVWLTPTITRAGFKYSITVISPDGTSETFTHVNGSSETVSTICAAIETGVNAFAAIVTANADPDPTHAKVICTTNTAGVILGYDVGRGIDITDSTADAGFASDIANIADQNSNWYGMVTDVQSKAYILAASLWTEANKKIYLPQTADSNVVDPNETSANVASALKALSYTRTWGIYHRRLGGTEWANAAWLASTLSFPPGNATTAFKTLAGVTIDELKSAEKTALTAKRFSRYTSEGGVGVTFEGRTPSGRFIDVTRFVDWLDATIKADALSAMINNPKLSYEDLGGLLVLKGALEGALRKGQTRPNDGLAQVPAPTVTIPPVAQQASDDRANRIVNSIEFDGRLSGALHGLKIRGTLSP